MGEAIFLFLFFNNEDNNSHDTSYHQTLSFVNILI